MALFMKALNSCGLDIDRRKRKIIPTWNSSRKYKVLKSFTVCLVSIILDTRASIKFQIQEVQTSYP